METIEELRKQVMTEEQKLCCQLESAEFAQRCIVALINEVEDLKKQIKELETKMNNQIFTTQVLTNGMKRTLKGE